MIRIAVIVLMLGLSVWASDDSIQSQVEAALARRTPPRSGEWWQRLGKNTPRALVSYFHQTASAKQRVRAVEVMRHFNDPQTSELLKAQALGRGKPIVRRAAARSLIVSAGMKEKATYETLLQDPDPHLRVAVAEGLRALHQSEADALVDAFAAQETQGWVVQRSQAKQATTIPNGARRIPPANDPRQ